MNKEFWYERWINRQTGFHQNTVNDHLKAYWPKANLSEGARVLVPLCGKSKDMLWLCEHGYSVTGVELSEVALDEFCQENELQPVKHQESGSIVCEIRPDFSFICSDFFNLSAHQIGEVDAVYDRAALVALPPDMRVDYVNHLDFFLKPGARIFLMTLEYEAGQISGPPFSVSEAEVNRLFSGRFEIELVHAQELSAKRPGIAQNKPVEKIYLITKKD